MIAADSFMIKPLSDHSPSMGGGRKPSAADPQDDVANTGQDDDNDDDDAHVRERDLVEAYVHEHALEESLNEVINDVVAARPADPFLVLSSLLFGRATAKRGIFHVECKEILDGVGLPGVLVRIHTGKGVFEASCSSQVAGRPDRPEDFGETHDEFAPTIPLHRQRCGGHGYKRRAEKAQVVLAETLLDIEPSDQQAIDAALLAVETLVGRNVCLAASIAVCKAGAKYAELPVHEYVASLCELSLEHVCLPMPLFSVINTGVLASSPLFVQEIFVAPVSATRFSDALHLGAAFSRCVRDQLESRGVGFCNTGAFGGFAPQLQTIAETFQILRAALEELKSRIERGGGPTAWLLDSASVTPLRLEMGIDFAASAFVTPALSSSVSASRLPGEEEDGGGGSEAEAEQRTVFTYNTDKWVPGSMGVIKSSDEMLETIQSCIKELDVATVVDPFDRGDIKAFAALMSGEHDTNDGSGGGDGGDAAGGGGGGGDADSDAASHSRRSLGGDPSCRLQVVARDLVDGHGLEAIQEERAANTVLLRLDAFASVSRMLAAITEARRYGMAVILGASVAQSGSEAPFLAALAIGTGVGQVKFGGLASAECVDRYNQLLLASEDIVAPAFVGGSSYRR